MNLQQVFELVYLLTRRSSIDYAILRSIVVSHLVVRRNLEDGVPWRSFLGGEVRCWIQGAAHS